VLSFLIVVDKTQLNPFRKKRSPRNSFPHLRTINLQSSFEFTVLADEVLELLLENENIKLRLKELNAVGMTFSESFHTLKKQFKGVEYFDRRVQILKPPSD